MRRDAHQAPLARPHMARATGVPKSGTPVKLYPCETLRERLAQGLQHTAAALGPFIQAEDAVVGQRYVARQRHVAPADRPDIRDRLMRSATRPGRHHRGAVTGEPSDAMEARGLDGVGQRHRRQDRGESPGQPPYPLQGGQEGGNYG